jgi:predicted acylesterase/phospholipase RssA
VADWSANQGLLGTLCAQILGEVLSADRGIFWLPGLLALGLVIAVLLGRRHFTEILLRRYHLLDSLANPHPLRQIFVRLFDPHYYGRLRLPEMLDAALKDKNSKNDPSRAPKTLGEFAKAGIYVAPVAADIETGHLTVLPLKTPVVKALLAAMAVVPLFRHQKLEKEDGGRGLLH